MLDNLSNCSSSVQDRINKILNTYYKTEKENYTEFHKIDVLDFNKVCDLFKKKVQDKEPINYIIHFAGKKAVGEAVSQPLWYYENNFVGSLNLMKAMVEYKCKNFIFSSTATVYGCSNNCTEESPINPLQPYAETKICVEWLMKSLAKA